MTLNDIITAALLQLDRGHDPVTLERWRNKLTRFVNDGVQDLACAFKPTRREEARLDGSMLDTATLERPCLKVVAVLDGESGVALRHTPEDASGVMSVRAVGTATVVYQYLPREVNQPGDVPELPETLHPLIVLYAVARERMSGDVSTQGGANAYLQLYEAGKARLLSATYNQAQINNKFDVQRYSAGKAGI